MEAQNISASIETHFGSITEPRVGKHNSVVKNTTARQVAKFLLNACLCDAAVAKE